MLHCCSRDADLGPPRFVRSKCASVSFRMPSAICTPRLTARLRTSPALRHTYSKKVPDPMSLLESRRRVVPSLWDR